MKTKIPSFIINAPSDEGKDNDSAADWAWVISHEINLCEEGEDSDISSYSELKAAKKCLKELMLESAA
jgi:hypothetical protein